MNAAVLRPLPAPRRIAMTTRHLDAVLEIEHAAYPFPWSRGNFIDALAAGYDAQLLLDADDPSRIVGYSIAMAGVDEIHLLNLTVRPECQRRGFGRRLLDALVADGRAALQETPGRSPFPALPRGVGGAQPGPEGVQQLRLLLEVRVGNQGARTLYTRYGFKPIGLRRGYYPAPLGAREDAVVMQLQIEAADGLD